MTMIADDTVSAALSTKLVAMPYPFCRTLTAPVTLVLQCCVTLAAA